MYVKLFTHTDLDGIGCSILAQMAFGSNIDIEYCDYSQVNDQVNAFLDLLPEWHTTNSNPLMVFITDISVNSEVAERIQRVLEEYSNVQFLLLDHHQTALELNRYDWAIVKTKHDDLDAYPLSHVKCSGTSLFYCHLMKSYYSYIDDKSQLFNAFRKFSNFPHELYKFVELIRLYDTWEWANQSCQDAKDLNDVFMLVGRSAFMLDVIQEFDLHGGFQFNTVHQKLLQFERRRISEYIDQMDSNLFERNILGYRAGIVFADRYISELGNELNRRHPELDFIMIVNLSKGTISYRTIHDHINLGTEIASVIGNGGGHPKAAGSSLPESQHIFLSKMMDLLFDDFLTDTLKTTSRYWEEV